MTIKLSRATSRHWIAHAINEQLTVSAPGRDAAHAKANALSRHAGLSTYGCMVAAGRDMALRLTPTRSLYRGGNTGI